MMRYLFPLSSDKRQRPTNYKVQNVVFLTANEARALADKKLKEYILRCICEDILKTLNDGKYECVSTFENVSEHFERNLRLAAYDLRSIPGYAIDWVVDGNRVSVTTSF